MTSIVLIVSVLLAGTTKPYTYRFPMPTDEQCAARAVEAAKEAFTRAPSGATITIACEFVKK